MDQLTADDIHALVTAGEGQTLEFKLESENQSALGELLISLANAEGGTILFGITDDGHVQGLQRRNNVESTLVAAARTCRPPLIAYLVTYPVRVEGKEILVAQVSAPPDQVYAYGPVYRRREGAENVLLSAEQLRYMLRQRMSHDFDAHPLEIAATALDPTQVIRLLTQRAELIQLRGSGDPPPVPAYPSPAAFEQLQALRTCRHSGHPASDGRRPLDAGHRSPGGAALCDHPRRRVRRRGGRHLRGSGGDYGHAL